MLNVTTHQRNTNENHTKVSPYTCQNGYHQQINQQQELEKMWRKGTPSALLVGMQTGAANVENSMKFP